MLGATSCSLVIVLLRRNKSTKGYTNNIIDINKSSKSNRIPPYWLSNIIKYYSHRMDLIQSYP